MKIDFKMRSTNFECVTFWRDSVAFQTDFFVIRCASVFCVLPALTWVARILIESGKKKLVCIWTMRKICALDVATRQM